jgi:hypothetical protein
MNNSCAWFKKHYSGAISRNLMIIWTKTVGPAAGFTQDVQVMRPKKLELLVKNTKAFFGELKGMDLQDLSEAKLQANLERYHLTVEALVTAYSEAPVQQ